MTRVIHVWRVQDKESVPPGPFGLNGDISERTCVPQARKLRGALSKFHDSGFYPFNEVKAPRPWRFLPSVRTGPGQG